MPRVATPHRDVVRLAREATEVVNDTITDEPMDATELVQLARAVQNLAIIAASGGDEISAAAAVFTQLLGDLAGVLDRTIEALPRRSVRTPVVTNRSCDRVVAVRTGGRTDVHRLTRRGATVPAGVQPGTKPRARSSMRWFDTS